MKKQAELTRKQLETTFLLASVCALITGLGWTQPANSQSFLSTSTPVTVPSVKVALPTYTPPPPPPPTFTPPPPPPPIIPPPPQMTTPPPPMVHFPVMPQPQMVPLNQLDVNAQTTMPEPMGQNANALAGIQTLSDSLFPNQEDANGNPEWLLIRQKVGADVQKLSPLSARLNHGQIIASVRRPTRLAFVSTTGVTIALTGDADVMVCAENDAVRVTNLDGRGETVKIKVDAKLISSQSDKVLALAPGYELVIANHVLQSSEVRLADGCARRHFKLLEDGKMSVCEICTETVVTSSELVAEMDRQPTDKEKRVLADMSKMAAVLNYINGTEGFTVEPRPITQVAHRQ
jgi:hypothetical protein